MQLSTLQGSAQLLVERGRFLQAASVGILRQGHGGRLPRTCRSSQRWPEEMPTVEMPTVEGGVEVEMVEV